MKPAIITDVQVDDERITFALSDGRVVSAPTSWSNRLTSATAEERAAYRVGGSGTHVEWPGIDEHIGLWTHAWHARGRLCLKRPDSRSSDSL